LVRVLCEFAQQIVRKPLAKDLWKSPDKEEAMTRLGRVGFTLTLSLVILTLSLVLLAGQHTAKGSQTALLLSEKRADQQITILVDDF
jgi:hypothetical protein